MPPPRPAPNFADVFSLMWRIFCREITPAPGKLYDIRAASSQVSNVLASHGTRLPPKVSSGRLEEKQRRAKLNANPYTRLRRAREGDQTESYHFGNRSFEF